MARKKKKEKELKPINIAFWAPLAIALGLAIGFVLSYLTFVHFGGN